MSTEDGEHTETPANLPEKPLNLPLSGDLPAKPRLPHELAADPDPSQNLSSAFSRRRSDNGPGAAPKIDSPYIVTTTEKPAWLKSEQPTQKYDKYGARPAHQAQAAPASSTNDRYSKYVSNAASQGSRVKRKLEESGNDSRENDNAPPDAAEIDAHRRRQEEYYVFQSKIANRETENINNVVRLHYNQKVSHSRIAGSRTKSPIYKLRNFNNTIKYMLIGSNAVREPDSNKPFVILDLCCGKGGDLNKCEFVGIDNYIGIDISDMSVKEAFSRFRKSKAHFKVHDRQRQNRENRKYNFEACFATGDCFSTTVPDMLEPNFPGIINHLFPVDCVSIQFALHYAFETEEKVNMVITNISRSLRQGGTFVGSIPSSDFLRDKISRQDYTLTDSSKPSFGNSLYSVKFDNALPEGGIFRPPYGNRYVYNLKDAVDDVPEYVVPFETLRALCESHGLRLRYKKNFLDIFRDEIPQYFTRLNSNLIEGLKRLDGKYGLEGEEKEAAAFYIGFVFEKL